MKVQKYKCWAEDLGDTRKEAPRGEYHATCPEDAAEYYLEGHWDGHEGDTEVSVEAPDGTVYGVTVSVERPRPKFSGRQS